MSIRNIQEEVDKWAKQFNPPYWPPLEQMARLTEETGEVARVINHLHGTKKKKESEGEKHLGEELADVMFTVCCLANNHKINLDEEWKKIMQYKHYGRDNNRFEKNPKEQGLKS